MRFLFILIFTLQYLFPADSINIAIYSKPFVKYVGLLPPSLADPNKPDTSKTNPDKLIDNSYFTFLEFPTGPNLNIGSYVGMELPDSFSIQRVRLVNLFNTISTYKLRIRGYQLFAASKDTMQWELVAENPNNLDTVSTYLDIIPAEKSKKWKFLKLVLTSQDKTLSTVVSEFQVYIVGNPASIFTKPPTSPDHFFVSQNFPNPFNPQTRITFGLAASGLTSLTIYDVLGREVASVVNEFMEAGTHSRDFSSPQLNSGVYFYTLRSGKFTETKKMMILK